MLAHFSEPDLEERQTAVASRVALSGWLTHCWFENMNY